MSGLKNESGRPERPRVSGMSPEMGKGGSQSISRVLSRTAIHLRRTSPCACSDLPGSSAGHTNAPLFGLAPSGVYRAAACYHPRGALLPHLFTLACARRPSAVCFLWHFPWAHAPQALPGTPPCGARTFLHAPKDTATVRPTPVAYLIMPPRRRRDSSRARAYTDRCGPHR